MKFALKLSLVACIAFGLAGCDASFWEGNGSYSYHQPFWPNDNHIDYHHNHRHPHWSDNGVHYHHNHNKPNHGHKNHHGGNGNHHRPNGGGGIHYHKNHRAKNDQSGNINIHSNDSQGLVTHAEGFQGNNLMMRK